MEIGYGILFKDAMKMEISPYAKLIYCCLLVYAGDKEICWPSLATITKDLKITRPTAIKYLKELEEAGVINVTRDSTKVNKYTLASKGDLPELVKDVYQSSKGDLPALVKDVYPKNNNRRLTIKKSSKLKFRPPLENQDKVFKSETLKVFNETINLFPEKFRPKNEPGRKKWLDTIEKLIQIDNYPPAAVKEVISWAREDPFWQKNFLSVLKLRSKDKNGTKFFDRFQHEMKDSTKKTGYNTKPDIDEVKWNRDE